MNQIIIVNNYMTPKLLLKIPYYAKKRFEISHMKFQNALKLKLNQTFVFYEIFFAKLYFFKQRAKTFNLNL